MDRQIVYPGQIPLETDLLNTNRNVLVGLGLLIADILGTATLVSGLPCTQTTVPSMQVAVGAGRLYALENVDNTAYSSLAADTTDQIVKQGILLQANAPVALSCPAPSTSGYSINYLIEAGYEDEDTNLIVLPYYNASNPSQAYSGPNNDGTSQATTRQGLINLVAKAGIPAPTGTQTTPAADSGMVGLYVVTVAYGATTIVNANISQASGAPFLTETLMQKISTATGNGLYASLSAFNALQASGQFTATCPDISGDPTQTVYYARCGNIVQLYSPGGAGLAGASTTSNLSLTGLPSGLIPARAVQYGAQFPGAENAGTGCNAMVAIANSGLISFYQITSTGIVDDWTASGTKELPTYWSLTYSLV